MPTFILLAIHFVGQSEMFWLWIKLTVELKKTN